MTPSFSIKVQVRFPQRERYKKAGEEQTGTNNFIFSTRIFCIYTKKERLVPPIFPVMVQMVVAFYSLVSVDPIFFLSNKNGASLTNCNFSEAKEVFVL